MGLEIQLKCNECHQTLDGVVQGGILYVNPCPICAKIRNEVYEDGYEDGYKDGLWNMTQRKTKTRKTMT